MAAEELGAAAAFADLVDLASARLGGEVLAVSDEFFAEASNLIRPGRGVFLPDEYTDRGKWMDGWESRRKRVPGHDWCVLKLGAPGVIHGLDIDTNHFTGNHASMASLEACEVTGKISMKQLLSDRTEWVEVRSQAQLKRGSQNLFAVKSSRRFTHVRLRIFPDGGVARLRVYGEVRPDLAALRKQRRVDLAAVANGGRVVAVNDMYFGSPHNMLFPEPAPHMGDGWETRRKRDWSEDWAVVLLGLPGMLEEVEIDTSHFKGNYPDSCVLEGLDAREKAPVFFRGQDEEWREILPRTKLTADDRLVLGKKALKARGPFTHVRLRIFPDGGVSRLRLRGQPDWDGLEA